MCYNGTFRFKKLDDSFWNGETFRFADYITGYSIYHSVMLLSSKFVLFIFLS